MLPARCAAVLPLDVGGVAGSIVVMLHKRLTGAPVMQSYRDRDPRGCAPGERGSLGAIPSIEKDGRSSVLEGRPPVVNVYPFVIIPTP